MKSGSGREGCAPDGGESGLLLLMIIDAPFGSGSDRIVARGTPAVQAGEAYSASPTPYRRQGPPPYLSQQAKGSW
jgi:hypothetical protein